MAAFTVCPGISGPTGGSDVRVRSTSRPPATLRLDRRPCPRSAGTSVDPVLARHRPDVRSVGLSHGRDGGWTIRAADGGTERSFRRRRDGDARLDEDDRPSANVHRRRRYLLAVYGCEK